MKLRMKRRMNSPRKIAAVSLKQQSRQPPSSAPASAT
jgi:hypothetical protein